MAASLSTPIRINQTPLGIPPSNRQCFIPALAVAADGTIGVTHYDFRFNGTGPGLPTDYWLARCQPSLTRPATNPANWGNEVRLTDRLVQHGGLRNDLRSILSRRYFGLATVGNDFVSAFTLVDQDNVTSIFFRRINK